MNMKGLLKGLKYFTQIFEEEEEDNDMQIGLPTDVKHVAHIGWDGPSVNSPSWMNEFKSPAPGSSSTPPLLANGETNNREIEEPKDSSSVKKSSVKESPGRDTPGLPKSSRRQQSWDSIEADSPNMSPTHIKSKSSSSSRRRHNKNARGGESSSSSNNNNNNNNSSSLPNIPKKSRRKKSKDIDGSNKSSKSKDKDKDKGGSSIHGSEDGSTKHYSEPNSTSTLAEHQVDDSW